MLSKFLPKLFFFLIITALGSFLLHLKMISVHGNNFSDIERPEVVNQHRKSIVHIVCAEKNHTDLSLLINKNVAARLYIEHSHKFIYCEVPKVGCSNWKRVILLLNDSQGRTASDLRHYQVHTSPLLHQLGSYSQTKQKELRSNYTKVMFSRHPLERVVSAYRDKFLHEDDIYYSKNIANVIRKTLGINRDPKDKITFEEFIRFIVGENPEKSDVHWKPMYLLCDPCNISYDIIGKYETLSQDADFVLRTIRAPENLKYPALKHHSNDSRTNKEISAQFLKTLPPDLFRQLLHFYSIDFFMFEYDRHKILHPDMIKYIG